MTKEELWQAVQVMAPVHLRLTGKSTPAPGSVFDIFLEAMVVQHNDLERQLHDCLLQVATLKEELKAIQEPDVDDRRKR